MPYPATSPYDILEVGVTATPNDLVHAYQQALRKRRFPPATLRQALGELQQVGKRAEHDLLTLREPPPPHELRELLGTLAPVQFLAPGQVRPLPLLGLPISEVVGFVAKVTLPDSPLQLEVSTRYDRMESVLPPLKFPV